MGLQSAPLWSSGPRLRHIADHEINETSGIFNKCERPFGCRVSSFFNVLSGSQKSSEYEQETKSFIKYQIYLLNTKKVLKGTVFTVLLRH